MSIKAYEIHNSYLQDAPDSTGISRMVSEADYLSQLQQTDALQTSLNNIINAFGISGEGAHSKLVIEYVHGLVAESEAMKSVINECQAYFIAGIRNTIRPSNEGYLHMRCDTVNDEAPNTEAFTSELRAQGVDEFARTFNSETIEGSSMVMVAKTFAADLRAGRKG